MTDSDSDSDISLDEAREMFHRTLKKQKPFDPADIDLQDVEGIPASLKLEDAKNRLASTLRKAGRK